MIKFIKKHFNKIFIGILTLISAIAIGIGITSNYNKSYAYETNQISYTVSNIYDSSNNEITITTKSLNNTDYSGYYIPFYNTYNFKFNIKTNLTLNGNYTLLMNCFIIDDNNNYFTSSTYYWVNFLLNNNNIYNGRCNTSYGHNDEYMYSFAYGSTSLINSSDNINIEFNRHTGNLNSTYRLFIINIDFVKQEDVALAQYYETYYEQIEDNYNTLLGNYNDLQDSYDTLNNNYSDLQTSYDLLETNYTNLNNNYANIQSLSQYGDFYGSQIRISGNNLTTINYNFNDLITNNIIINNSINFKTLLDYANINPIDTPCNVDFFLNSNLNVYVNQIYWNINNSNLSGFTADFELLDLLDETFNVSINSYAMPYILDYRSFIDDIVGSNVSLSNEKLESMSLFINYSLTNDFIISCSTQFQSGYNFGYNSGYSSGVDSSSDVINSLKDNVSSLNSQVNDLQSTINTQSNIITNLNQQVSDLAENNLGWQSIFFTMADTPLKVVHSVLLGDSGNWFFGVNLYSVFIGVIVALACIWIIKKFL